jgi:hypothetical protein
MRCGRIFNFQKFSFSVIQWPYREVTTATSRAWSATNGHQERANPPSREPSCCVPTQGTRDRDATAWNEPFRRFCVLKSHFAWHGRGLCLPHGGRATSGTMTCPKPIQQTRTPFWSVGAYFWANLDADTAAIGVAGLGQEITYKL